MRRAISVFVFSLMISGVPPLNAYEPGTHGEIAQRAAQPSVSSPDRVLREELGLPDGVRRTFPGVTRPGPRSVVELVGDGAESEDVPSRRVLSHFHNPLVDPWAEAGLNVFLAGGQSSVLWQQDAAQETTTVRLGPFSIQAGGGNRSWQDARGHYLDALTRGNEPGRDRTFGEMFETLGHLTLIRK